MQSCLKHEFQLGGLKAVSKKQDLPWLLSFPLPPPDYSLQEMWQFTVWIQPWAGGFYINLEILFNSEHEPKDLNPFRPEKNSCFCHATSFANKTTGINYGRQQFLVSTKQFCKWPDFLHVLSKNPPNLMRTTLPSQTSSTLAHPYFWSSSHPLWDRKHYVLMKTPMTLAALR